MLTTKEINYFHEETLCRGFLAFDDEWTIPHPTVMIAPDWRGRGEVACDTAKQMVQLGYVGFAIDMYGEAKLGTDDLQRRALMTPLLEDRKKLSERIRLAFSLLSNLMIVDAQHIAAIGYRFGGLCVLDLARSGVDIKGVVSFQGLLSPSVDLDQKPIKAQILVLHRQEDPLVSPEQVNQFAQEMAEQKVDWQIHQYGNAAHAFTNPEADDTTNGLRYNMLADKRSWQSAEQFLAQLFEIE